VFWLRGATVVVPTSRWSMPADATDPNAVGAALAAPGPSAPTAALPPPLRAMAPAVAAASFVKDVAWYGLCALGIAGIVLLVFVRKRLLSAARQAAQ
jgi:hypothetical protein